MMEIELDENDNDLRFSLHKEDLFQEYYNRGFPFFKVYKWLSYANMTESGKILDEDKKDYFKRREISYVKLTADGKEEFTIRHLCYDNPKSFESNAKQMNPIRIDIGPVCDIPPEVNKNNLGDKKAVAEEREYVIDIDMNDYDSIRTCCSGASMCQSCWQYISAAKKVLEPSLKDDFGFRHILWVFSGRRGVHAWVCDERARVMDNNIRSSVTEYLSLAIANEKSDRLVKESVIWESNFNYGLFNRSYAILEPIFEGFMVVEQAYFWYDKNIERVFQVLHRIIREDLNKPDNYAAIEASLHTLKQEVLDCSHKGLKGFPSGKDAPNRAVESRTSADEASLSKERWNMILRHLKKERQELTLEKFRREVILGLMYPKLDAHVSAQTNHLLKCPFNVHKATGKVSVPVLDFENFKMKDVPHIVDVIGDKDGRVMGPWIKIFDDFCERLYVSEIKPLASFQRQMGKETTEF